MDIKNEKEKEADKEAEVENVTKQVTEKEKITRKVIDNLHNVTEKER